MKKILYATFILFSCSLLLAGCSQDDGLQESQFIYFSITEPYTRIGGIACTVDNSTLTITNNDPIPAGIDLTNVTPYFVLNHEAKGVFVKGVEQKSGVTRQNLTTPVVYEVVSERGTLKYTVDLTQSETIQTQAGVKMSYLDMVGEITSERESWIDPALRFSEVDFTAADDGRPLRLDLFEIDLSHSDIALYPLTPGHYTEAPASGSVWPVQTIPDQAAAAEAAGVKILGAVNGDFYDINSTNIPEGPMCRDGKWIKEDFLSETDTHYFGVRKDGRTSIGGIMEFQKLQEQMSFAIGARQVLLTGNAPADAIKNDRPNAHRVGIGTNALDHMTVIIACIEGLDGSASAVRMVEIAQVLKAFGAAEALNLDGGGSATFVIKEDGSFKAVNRPDGPLRKVANGIAIIKK